jgi:predicted ATP-binding protein involved in virulence
MVYLDYRLAKDNNDTKAQQMRRVGETAITKLLPGDVKIAEVTADGLIHFTVNGQKVPTISLSDGFRSVIALAGDLIWRLLQAFPDLDDPTQASGVVLIDELDIHLHPSWQREIAGWLREVFPNLQFFVATHSPLVAAGGGEDALTLRLDIVEGELQATEIPYRELAADADRTLRSPAFSLKSTYPPVTDKKIKRYHELSRNKGKLVGPEKEEYKQLELFMQEVRPIGIPPESGSLEARIETFLEKNLP